MQKRYVKKGNMIFTFTNKCTKGKNNQLFSFCQDFNRNIPYKFKSKTETA